jgi:hypothetical protein
MLRIFTSYGGEAIKIRKPYVRILITRTENRPEIKNDLPCKKRCYLSGNLEV